MLTHVGPGADEMIAAWTLALLMVALAVVALARYQKADTWSGRVISGAAAMILGVPGLVFLAALILG